METPAFREWHLGKAGVLFVNIAGTALCVIGLVLYVLAWSGGGGSASFAFDGWTALLALAVTLALTLVLMIVHEAIHGLVIVLLGSSATFGVAMIARAIPAFYCTAPGARFTKTRFLAIALAPTVVLGLVCAVIVAFVPLGGWLVVPAALHLGGCVGDLALAWVAIRQPRGTLLEDIKTGVRFHDGR